VYILDFESPEILSLNPLKRGEKHMRERKKIQRRKIKS
jgi:hypothetical protein